MQQKTGVLLIQLGTPDSPSTLDVARYLGEFLNDPRVIDLPWLVRKILVNGKESTEPYIFAGNKPSDMQFNVTVPKGKLWVMGDHRGASADSRYHQDDINKGFVPESDVVGRVVSVIWPIKNAKLIERVNASN